MIESVHRAGWGVFDEDAVASRAWADELLQVLRHGGYDPAWERLVQRPARLRCSPKKRHAADRLLNYVSQRRAMIRYPVFRQQGWQIGSGRTESQCQLAVGRWKGRSRR